MKLSALKKRLWHQNHERSGKFTRLLKSTIIPKDKLKEFQKMIKITQSYFMRTNEESLPISYFWNSLPDENVAATITSVFKKVATVNHLLLKKSTRANCFAAIHLLLLLLLERYLFYQNLFSFLNSVD